MNLWAIQSHFSILQEAVKRILKQKSHLYKAYNKSHKESYFKRSVMKSYFAYGQSHSIRKPLK